MDITWGFAIFLVLVVVGVVRIVYKIIKVSIRKSYTNKYLKNYSKWLKMKDKNHAEELYTWLTQNTGHIQNELGQTGVAANYVAPMAAYALTNYEIIVNTLPIIKTGLATELEVNACKDALNRHIGNLRCARKVYFLELINLFKWVLEGAKTIITFPLYLFYCLGLYEYSKIISVKENKGFKIVSGIVALISFWGLIQGIVVDWNDFWNIIKQIKK